ncbi:hypothetical protein [Spongiimicrobium sp. 2-473A-2-J]|uniref:hypothetical protein n=1 Tax=Eudoraea algarum TaxID=3417568 RepID=UPI003D35FE67
MLSEQEKQQLDTLSREDLRALFQWMIKASISTYRNDEGALFDAEYYSFWDHYRYVKKLATVQGIPPHGLSRGDRSGYAHQSQSFYAFKRSIMAGSTDSMAPGTIILDQPLIGYSSICQKADEVLFLCGNRGAAHLITLLREFGIKFTFLDRPREEWDSWKKKPNYRGK